MRPFNNKILASLIVVIAALCAKAHAQTIAPGHPACVQENIVERENCRGLMQSLTPPATQEVSDILQLFTDGVRARDAARILAHVVPDAVVTINPTDQTPATTMTWTRWVEAARPDQAFGFDALAVRVLDIDGSQARVTAQYGVFVGDTPTPCGAVFLELRREQNDWRIADTEFMPVPGTCLR